MSEETKELTEETSSAVAGEQVSDGQQTEEITSDEQGGKEEGEQEPGPEAPPEKKWFEDLDNGRFKSEEEAVKSMKEQRAWTTKTAQDNSRLKREKEAYRKFANGELDTDNVEEYLAKEEERAVGDQEAEQAREREWAGNVKLILEVGKAKWPEVVTDANIPFLDPFFKLSTKETPLERLEDAVQAFVKIQGSNMSGVKETQEQMKMLANGMTETPGGKKAEVKKNDWENMSSEEFRKEADRVAMGLP